MRAFAWTTAARDLRPGRVLILACALGLLSMAGPRLSTALAQEPEDVPVYDPGADAGGSALELERPLLQTSGLGAYAGFPSAIGVFFVAPADGTLAFRSGLTAFPGVGVLWSPGYEIRFGQESGTYAHNSGYLYTNLLLARIYTGEDRDHTGLEAGLGYRWILSDVRELRWIAGAEAGGHWDTDSYRPDRPSLRFYWMMAGM